MFDEIKIVSSYKKQMIAYSLDELVGNHLSQLATRYNLNNQMSRSLEFEYRNHTLVIQGIEDDFKAYLDDALVLECTHGHIYNANKTLCRLLFA